MAKLVFAAILFLLTHLGISSTGMRARLVNRLGKRGYLALYSGIALVTFIYLVLAYVAFPVSHYYWVLPGEARIISAVLTAIGFILLVGGFLTKNPTATGQAEHLAVEPQGVIRITRHPFQWGVVAWSIAHLIANGDSASIVFFGTFGVLAFVGTFLMDAKKTQLPHWSEFAAVTSNVPLVAIVGGRVRLAPSELVLPSIVGLAIFAAAFYGHRWIAGIAL